MSKYVKMVKVREEEIAKLIDFLSGKTSSFEEPKLILIGGYGLRAFVPFMRTTRDCDFIVVKKGGGGLDDVKKVDN